MRSVIAILGLALAAVLPAAAADEQLDTRPAIASAESWLRLIDAGRYGEGWEQASHLFRDAVAREQWEPQVDKARTPLGPVQVRKMRAAAYARELPGAPPGEYVVIQYETVFANRPRAIETITPMREKDGSWRIAGYYIR